MVSPSRWMWVWASSGSWWWTGNPLCCSPRGRKELDMTEGLNWTKLGGVVVYSWACQAPDGPASIIQLPVLACGDREALVMALPSTCDLAVLPCFLGCLVSSTGISHHNLLPHIPSIRLSAVNSSPCLGIAPQSLSSSSQPLCLLGALHPWVHMAAARTVWFSFHLGCHRSAVSLSALNVSPLTQTVALMWGSDPCFSSATHWGQVQS